MDSANLAAQSKQDPEHVDMRAPGFQNRKPSNTSWLSSACGRHPHSFASLSCLSTYYEVKIQDSHLAPTVLSAPACSQLPSSLLRTTNRFGARPHEVKGTADDEGTCKRGARVMTGNPVLNCLIERSLRDVKVEASAPKVSFESRRAAITVQNTGERAPISHPGIRRASVIPKLVEMRTPCQPQDAYLTLTGRFPTAIQPVHNR